VKADLPKVGDTIQVRCGGTKEFWLNTLVFVVIKDCDGYTLGCGLSIGQIRRLVRLCDVGVTWRWPPEPCPSCGHLPK
jgi:hypothetical protein